MNGLKTWIQQCLFAGTVCKDGSEFRWVQPYYWHHQNDCLQKIINSCSSVISMMITDTIVAIQKIIDTCSSLFNMMNIDTYLHLHNFFPTPGVFHKKSSSQCANRTKIYSTYFRAVRNHCKHNDIRSFIAWTINISPSIVTQSKSI